VPTEARTSLVGLVKGRDGPGERDRALNDVVHAISTLPEFQLT
jgi:hypothetical protein